MQVRVSENKPIGSCGCGRSPTGNCIGWHGLSEDEYRIKLAEHKDRQNKNSQYKPKQIP